MDEAWFQACAWRRMIEVQAIGAKENSSLSNAKAICEEDCREDPSLNLEKEEQEHSITGEIPSPPPDSPKAGAGIPSDSSACARLQAGLGQC